MASLDQAERLAWLASLADTVAKRSHDGTPGAYPQELAEVARGCRLALVDGLERQLGPFDRRLLDAVLEVPRERFVRVGDVGRSADDMPLPLDDAGLATISAPHAYCLSFRLLALSAGDALIELGAGTGYGAALGAFIVGSAGRVTTFEIDPTLARAAARSLSDLSNVTVREGDAVESADRWGNAKKVVATFAVDAIPPAWLDALPEGGSLVVPVGAADRDQHLTLAAKRGGAVVQTVHGAVRYVKNRSRF
jgi:protein-L-isoaspartate(D-aspartate) O-methyltransferase